MFVRRHRLTIEIEQQTLRIHQRTASDATDPEQNTAEQSHHTSAAAIVPEAKLPTPDFSNDQKKKTQAISPSIPNSLI